MKILSVSKYTCTPTNFFFPWALLCLSSSLSGKTALCISSPESKDSKQCALSHAHTFYASSSSSASSYRLLNVGSLSSKSPSSKISLHKSSSLSALLFPNFEIVREQFSGWKELISKSFVKVPLHRLLRWCRIFGRKKSFRSWLHYFCHATGVPPTADYSDGAGSAGGRKKRVDKQISAQKGGPTLKEVSGWFDILYIYNSLDCHPVHINCY